MNRCIALYAALMLEGTPAEKAAYYSDVKKAYSIRSKAVHGGRPSIDKLEDGYRTASLILIRLLARCVEIGRVPTVAEFDQAAVPKTLYKAFDRLDFSLHPPLDVCWAPSSQPQHPIAGKLLNISRYF
ncbi:hypothetical protein [Rhizobium sullae]|uniref:hypothetical protein n=1 Tax=Rhizobium sullae TaxID=50338 RepID=UPI0010478728|nr:hypothetical protein [Rhizobium sullae]